MDGGMLRIWKMALPLLLVCLVLGCQRSQPVEQLPEVGSTLEAIGRRLSGSLSEARLTAFATRGPVLLAALNAREREILGRGYLRFHSDVPILVVVAAPVSAVPFWIRDQGFVAMGTVMKNVDTTWSLFRKPFPAGWVGLGVNGLDRTPPAHYVVFLREQPGHPPLRGDELTLSSTGEREWSRVQARSGVSAARDVHRPFEVLPAELEGSVLLQPSQGRRHATLLARGRVWKTHVPARPGPDQVAISFGQDPARELVWNWRTTPEVEGTAIRLLPARFEAIEHDAEGSPDLSRMRLERGTSSLVRTPDLLNDPVNRRHVTAVGGLSPDTTYLYSLGDGTPGRWGPWRTVKTGRPAGGINEFLYMGDAQTGLEDWGKRLVTAFRRHPGLEFILLAGDLVDRGNERTNWDHFFLRATEIFERVPVMPCVGNHEYLDQGPRLYRSFFSLPKNGPQGVEPGLVYGFEHGGAFFAILDSTLASSDARQARRQAEWLDHALSETLAAWKFVMFHHPVYPSHPERDTPVLREHWVPIFDKHHVAMVLQGHDHAYLRTYPMQGHHPVASPREGTIYVVAVSGDKFYDQRLSDYIEVGFTRTSTYQTIEIDNVTDRLTYRAWTDEGAVVDQLVISRSPHSRPELAEREPPVPR
jgi:hypothetical protein